MIESFQDPCTLPQSSFLVAKTPTPSTKQKPGCWLGRLMLRDLPPPTIPFVHLGSDNKTLAWFHDLHHFSCTKQSALEESTHLSASNNRKTLSPKQRGTASSALGHFHNTYSAAKPTMGCWRILKKMKYLQKNEARLGQACWWDFWASYSHSFTCECVQKGHRTSFFGAVEQHKAPVCQGE